MTGAIKRPKNVAKYYTEGVSPYIGRLLVGVVSIGIVLLSSQYLQVVISQPELVTAEFWERVALVVGASGYAAYDLLIYGAVSKSVATGREMSAGKVVLTFLLDVAQILILAVMIQALFLNSPLGSAAALGDTIPIGVATFKLIFGAVAAWHIAILFWHFATGSAGKVYWPHILYAAVALVVVITLFLLNSSWYATNDRWFDWVLIVIFYLFVGTLLCIRAPSFINEHTD